MHKDLNDILDRITDKVYLRRDLSGEAVRFINETIIKELLGLRSVTVRLEVGGVKIKCGSLEVDCPDRHPKNAKIKFSGIDDALIKELILKMTVDEPIMVNVELYV